MTSTVPLPWGTVAVICVSLSTVKAVASVEPNLTALAPVKSVPLIVTVPPGLPWLGESEEIAGAAT